jgi:hypothetical protein
VRRSSIITLALAAALALALPVSASAGQPLVSLKVAKHKGGPYATGQPASIGLNQAKDFYWKVKNITNARLPEVLLTDNTDTSPGWIVRWFRGKDNITTDVQGGGYEFGLRAGKAKVFRSRLKPTEGAEKQLCHAATAGPPETSLDEAIVFVNDGLCAF